MYMRLILATVCGLATAAAFGQSFNVDMNRTSGNGAGVPASSYAAGAAQPGFWNDINSGTPQVSTLKNLDGTNSAVSFTRSLEGTFEHASDPQTSGDFDKLIEDYQTSSSMDMNFTFSNLQFGQYAVYTYTASPNSNSRAQVLVSNCVGDDFQEAGGNPAGNFHGPGLTYTLHIVNVNAGGSLTVKVIGFGSQGPGVVGGIQLVKMSASRVRFYVDKIDGTDADGRSWAGAFRDLQPVLKYAKIINGAYVEIWVANGFYYTTTGTSRSESFVIPAGLKMYGNFSGSESSIHDRPAGQLYPTYLSGSIGASGTADDAYHVVDASNTSSSTLLDGFYIVRGNANGSGADSRGGAIYMNGGNLVVRNCSLSNNRSSTDGGAVYMINSSPAFVESVFYNGYTEGEGGAVYVSSASAPYFLNCRFLGNSAVGGGGGIKVSFSNATMFGCLMSGNTAQFGDGGAIAVAGIAGHGMVIRNATISKNASTSGYCGGVFANKGVGTGVPSVTIGNSILWGNWDNIPGNPVGNQNLNAWNGALISRTYTTLQGFDADPQFVDADGPNNIAGDFDDNCRLLPTSPCIDAGNVALIYTDTYDLNGNNNTFEQIPLDLDRRVRRYDVPARPDTGTGGTPLIDRGAYEFSYNKGDMNCDGVVNFDDIDPFVAALSGPSAYTAEYPLCVWQNGDVNCDGVVDFDDIDAFVTCLSGWCGCL
ncbi:MAG: hypothetical protein IPM13_13670 [Phycisphaerales bacterium]|nr:hypothetical protein [Phycisphaerales bacterium]